MARNRCSSHKLGIETGLYTSEARHGRTCRLCNSATAIKDKQHILLHCPSLMTCAEPRATCSSNQDRL